MVEGVFAGAFLAGLAGSPHCVGMCGGFAVAAAGGRDRGLAWHAGRLLTYAGLGAVAGAVGHAVRGPTWLGPLLAALFLAWFSAQLAGLLPAVEPPIPGLVRLGRRLAGRTDPAGRLLFGMANGLLPCGLVYAALALPLAAGSAARGALAMVLFGLGTVPLLAVAAAGLRRVVARSLAARRILAGAVLALGLLTVGRSAGLLPRPHSAGAMHSAAPEAPAPH